MKNFDVVYDAAEADHMFWRVALHFWNKIPDLIIC